MKNDLHVGLTVRLFTDRKCFGPGVAELLRRVDEVHSLRAAAAVMAVLVCISTLTTRQHVLADAFAGILLSEISYGLAGIPAVRGAYARLADRLAGCLVSR